MNEQNLGGMPAEPSSELDFDHAWMTFTQQLGAVVAKMDDPDEDNHLVISVPSAEGAGCAPYAQVASFDAGTMIRAEISGNAYLADSFKCDADDQETMQLLGWEGNDDSAPNWYLEMELVEAVAIARLVTGSLRDCFSIAHPQLLSYEAWGPFADHATSLGLRHDDSNNTSDPTSEKFKVAAYESRDRDHLVTLVRLTLEGFLGEPVEVDGDEDFVVPGPAQPCWVRVRKDVPVIQIMAVPTYDVRSRRQTSVELGLLNRDNLLVRWTLSDRMVWQTIGIPAMPFAPGQLTAMIDHFKDVLINSRGDLSLRVGGKLAL